MLRNEHTPMDVVLIALSDYVLSCNQQIHSARDNNDIDRFVFWTEEIKLAHAAKDFFIKRGQ
jgi:hypothetical protein